MSDTPRTDKERELYDSGWARCPISIDFARELERENNRWRAAAKKLLENYQPNDRVFVEEVQELKDLLDANS